MYVSDTTVVIVYILYSFLLNWMGYVVYTSYIYSMWKNFIKSEQWNVTQNCNVWKWEIKYQQWKELQKCFLTVTNKNG